MNIDPADLELLNKSFKPIKPKIKGDKSIDEIARTINFGNPKITPDKEINKISINSLKIKDKNNKQQNQETQEPKIKIIISEDKKNQFSGKTISFIPYRGAYLSAYEALKKIRENKKNFEYLEDAYLNEEQINIILAKIEKITDLTDQEKNILKLFFNEILQTKKRNLTKRQKAQELLEKIKSKGFRVTMSKEIQRMIKGSGDLYNYYQNFDLIDEDIKKEFLSKIQSIDYYIVKKIKELIGFTNIDLFFRYDEIIKFLTIVETRNILMENFHQEVENLANENKNINLYLDNINHLLEKIILLAKDFGKNGKYGKNINNSTNLDRSTKENFFVKINNIIKPEIDKIQKIKLDLETQNYISLKLIKENLEKINLKTIEDKCQQLLNEIKF